MLTIILGRVGSGKSLFAMHLLIEELRRTSRHVVTTLSVDVGALNAYVQRKFPNEDLNVCGRIHCISKEGLKHFWRCRGLTPSCVPIFRGPFGDSSWVWPDNGIAYFLDEAQEGFNARSWASTGTEFTSYATQHRKLGDDIVSITPASGLLDKQFRMLCGECITLENWYVRKLGAFRAPRMITWKAWLNCPPDHAESSVRSGRIYIDSAGLAGCYRTEEGVGIVGRGADKGKVARGVPWYMVFVLIVIGGFLAWFGSSAAMAMVARKASHTLSGSNQAVVVPLTNAGPVNQSFLTSSTRLDSPVSTNVWWSGMAQLPGPKLMVFLSDGTTWRYPSLQVSSVTPSYVIVDGVKYLRRF